MFFNTIFDIFSIFFRKSQTISAKPSSERKVDLPKAKTEGEFGILSLVLLPSNALSSTASRSPLPEGAYPTKKQPRASFEALGLNYSDINFTLYKTIFIS